MSLGESYRPKKADVALLGIVITLLLQGATAVWWASKMDARLTTVEQVLQDRAKPLDEMAVTVARLDERSASQAQAIERIEKALSERRSR